MAFPKGKANPNAGRPKGAQAKVTMAAKEAIVSFIDGNSDRIQQWVDEVHQENGAKDALNAYTALLEFVVPKLARVDQDIKTDNKHTLRWSNE